MNTYAAKKEAFRKFRAELDKAMEKYQKESEANREELEKAKAIHREKEKALVAEYRKREEELNEWLITFKNETDDETMDAIINELNREEEINR